jgi:hypothetical protein
MTERVLIEVSSWGWRSTLLDCSVVHTSPCAVTATLTDD